MNETADLTALRDLLPFAALIGVELLQADAELVRARMQWSPERCTAGGLMHGGALMKELPEATFSPCAPLA